MYLYDIYIYICVIVCLIELKAHNAICDLEKLDPWTVNTTIHYIILYYIILYYIVLNYIILLYDMQICTVLSLHHNSLVGIKSVGIIYNGIYEYIIYNLTHAKLLISDNINI